MRILLLHILEVPAALPDPFVDQRPVGLLKARQIADGLLGHLKCALQDTCNVCNVELSAQ
jgi:hypothetical protein